MGLPIAASGQVHKLCAASLNACRMILAGYEHDIDKVNIMSSCVFFCLSCILMFIMSSGKSRFRCRFTQIFLILIMVPNINMLLYSSMFSLDF